MSRPLTCAIHVLLLMSVCESYRLTSITLHLHCLLTTDYLSGKMVIRALEKEDTDRLFIPRHHQQERNQAERRKRRKRC